MTSKHWRESALCAQTNPEMFFPASGYPGLPDMKSAKSVCARCPVRPECLHEAMETNMEHGIWGGMTRFERVKLKRETARYQTPTRQPCGTRGGYQRHKRNKESACAQCLEAHRKHGRELYAASGSLRRKIARRKKRRENYGE